MKERPSPLGFAKTYELWLWPTDANDPITPALQNAFAQGGVIAYADPDFAVQAGIPSPMSACEGNCPYPETDPSAAETPLSVIENAMANMFDYLTRPHQDPHDDTSTSRFGAIHFGDTFYQRHHATQRFWLNNGSTFSTLPWMLWLRSGDRRYRDFAEANARHVMDVDGSHVDRSSPGVLVVRGGQGSYNDIFHGGFQVVQNTHQVVGPKTNDTESIALAYYLTGYERAHDVLMERAVAFANEWPTGVLKERLDHLSVDNCAVPPPPNPNLINCYGVALNTNAEPGSQITVTGPQDQGRIVGELSILHEAVGDQVPLGPPATEFIDALLAMDNLVDDVTYPEGNYGWFNTSRAAWLAHNLVTAARVFPPYRKAIRQRLAREDQYYGFPAVPGPTGKVGGYRSLLSSLANYDETGDERVLRNAQGMMYAQAMSIHSAQSATGTASAWIGSGPMLDSYREETIRDWLAVLARQSENLDPSLPPAPYLDHSLENHQIVEDGPPSWNRFYVVKDIDEELYLPMDFHLDNGGVGRRTVDVETFDPAGNSLGVANYCLQIRGMRLFNFLGKYNSLLVDPDTSCANPSVVSY